MDDAIKRIAKNKYGDLGAGAIPSESRLAALEELLEYEKTAIEVIDQVLSSVEMSYCDFFFSCYCTCVFRSSIRIVITEMFN